MHKIISKYSIQYLIQLTFSLSILLLINDVTILLFSKANPSESIGYFQLISSAILTDFGIGGLFLLVIIFPYILIVKLNKSISQFMAMAAALTLLLANLSLNKYFDTTHTSLGGDIFGYSLADILMIIQTSTDLSFLSILSFFLFPLALIIINNAKFAYSFYKPTMIWPLLGGFILMIFAIGIGFKSHTNLAYFVTDSIEYKISKAEKSSEKWNLNNGEYPLMKPLNTQNDVLGQYLNLQEKKPNIVLLVIEGLGSDFSGRNAQFSGFTPYLDSLANQSLSWTNFVSNTGRSFGALPSIIGSAPFGENGFLELENIPAHLSLISLLKENGYKTSYFEGGDSNFDNKINYLQNEGIDFVLDESNFGPGYQKIKNTDNGFSWGYPDSEIFKKTLSLIKPLNQPSLNVVLSISNHEPFDFPGKSQYQSRAKKIRDNGDYSNSKKETITEYLDIFSSLLYTDNSVRDFMEEYKKKEDYENTIFFITGDHRLIPVPQKDAICRYHVPLLVYSPLQKNAQEFKGISSHMDITPSIITMLKNRYDAYVPEEVPWLGSNLSSSIEFVNDHEIPLMKYKGAFKDFISNSAFLSSGEYFNIKEDFSLSDLNDIDIQKNVETRFNYHRDLNSYVTIRDKIIPQELALVRTKKIIYSNNEKKIIKENTAKADLEEVYFTARDMAFNKKYAEALTLIKYINHQNPNHFDARTLKGRIYGWNGEFAKAQKELLEVINRSPLYSDAYSAILDLYWWNDKYEEALKINRKVQINFSDRQDFVKKMMESMSRFNPDDFPEVSSKNELKDDFLSIKN